MYKARIKSAKLFLDFIMDKNVEVTGVGNLTPFHNDKEYLKGFKYIVDRIATKNSTIQLINVEVNGYKILLMYIDFKENVFYFSLINPQGHKDKDAFVVFDKYFEDFIELTDDEIDSVHKKNNIYANYSN